jgi:hypothetical protein
MAMNGKIYSSEGRYVADIRGNEIYDLVARHSDFDRLGQAVRLTPAEFWDQRGVRYCELSLATF